MYFMRYTLNSTIQKIISIDPQFGNINDQFLLLSENPLSQVAKIANQVRDVKF